MKSVSKKSQKAIGAVVGIGAIGIGGYLAYKYFTRDKDYEPVPAEEPFVIPEIPISLENILLLIKDVSLTQAEKIAILETMYNEQFIFDHSTKTEIIQIESDIKQIDVEIALIIEGTKDFEEQVSITKKALTEHQNIEATKYNLYIVANNKLTELHAKLASANANRDRCWVINIICWGQYTMIIDNLSSQVAKQDSITSNAWNVYLDAKQLRVDGENEYNSAILVLELHKEEFLFPLQEQKIVMVNSLNSWQIAYQASQNLLTELMVQLGSFGVKV